jgi:PIN domain nuclease of toxin-antitoxin system
MRLLLDTLLIPWWQGMPDKVPTPARDLIENSEESVYVSEPRSLSELASWQSKWAWASCISICRVSASTFRPMDNSHLLTYTTLPRFGDHKGPFDRLLAAQSLSEPLILLTADSKLARYGETVKPVR